MKKKKKSCIWKSRLLADDVNKTVFLKICKTFTRVSKLLWSARSISFWARLDIHVVCSIVDWKQLMEKNGGCPVSDAIPSYVYSVVFRCSTRLDIDSRVPLLVYRRCMWEDVLNESPANVFWPRVLSRGTHYQVIWGMQSFTKYSNASFSGWSFGQPLRHCGRFSSTVKHRPIADLDIWGRLIFLKLIGYHKVNHFLIKVEWLADDWRLV